MKKLLVIATVLLLTACSKGAAAKGGIDAIKQPVVVHGAVEQVKDIITYTEGTIPVGVKGGIGYVLH